MDPVDFLDRPIAFHRCFVPISGGVAGAVFLSQLLYWEKRIPVERQGWMYKTGKEWEEETGLGRYEQEAARKKLRGVGVLEEELRGVPARLYFKLNINKLNSLLNSANKDVEFSKLDCGNLANKFDDSSKQDCGKTAIKIVEKQQTNTEITTEIIKAEATTPASASLNKIFVLENAQDEIMLVSLIDNFGDEKIGACAMELIKKGKRPYLSSIQKMLVATEKKEGLAVVLKTKVDIWNSSAAPVDPNRKEKMAQVKAKIRGIRFT